MGFIEKEIIEKYENGELVLSITKDFMKAYLNIKSKDVSISIDKAFLLDFLRKNIAYGIDEKQVEAIIQTNQTNSPVEIARGQHPVPGKDGFIKYYFDTNKKIRPHIGEDGKINFKELNFVENIKEGQILAEKIPPQEGIEGTNILGEKISAPVGKDVFLKIGKNIQLSKDGLKAVSSCDGRVEFKDNKISINTVLEIKGDVDVSTGNLKFSGDIIIYGDIKAGFSVENEGNVEVNGVIEGSIVNTKGNLIVKNGIQGSEKVAIFSGGNIVCKYIENAKIICEGDITTDFIVHSHILCQNSIHVVGRKGLIAGGEIKAKKEVIANSIGSPMGTKTYIEVGIDPKMKKMIQYQMEEKSSIEKNLKNLSTNINSYKEMIKRSTLDAKSKEVFLKTVEVYNQLSEKLEKINKQLELFQKEVESCNEGLVIINKNIFPGVKIGIGNFIKHIREEEKHVKFYIENKDIVMRSL